MTQRELFEFLFKEYFRLQEELKKINNSLKEILPEEQENRIQAECEICVKHLTFVSDVIDIIMKEFDKSRQSMILGVSNILTEPCQRV